MIILEESDAIGGISRTVRHNGCRMDIGGHRFFSKDQHVMDWWAAQMPLQGAMSFDDKMLSREKPLSPGGPDPEQTDRVMLIRQRISRIYYLDKFFDYPVSMKWRTIRNMGFMRTLKAGFSYLGAAIAKKPENSLEDFYINRFGRVLYSMFFEGYTEKPVGAAPERHRGRLGRSARQRAFGARHAQGYVPQSLRQKRRAKHRNLADRRILVPQIRPRPALGNRRR